MQEQTPIEQAPPHLALQHLALPQRGLHPALARDPPPPAVRK
jgi:hypothetical protein